MGKLTKATGKSREDLIKLGWRWLEHAPRDPGPMQTGLLGFSGALNVCSTCSGRILGRGCDLGQLADTPVWAPAEFSCDLCDH